VDACSWMGRRHRGLQAVPPRAGREGEKV